MRRLRNDRLFRFSSARHSVTIEAPANPVKDMEIRFERVGSEESQIRTLYDLLAKRSHGISHQEMPSYAQHREFVTNHPYRAWYLVKELDTYVGSFYITDQNTIGINIHKDFIPNSLPLIMKEVKGNYAPLPAIKSVRGGSFSVNVAPQNLELMAELERCGCLLAQVSYLVK